MKSGETSGSTALVMDGEDVVVFGTNHVVGPVRKSMHASAADSIVLDGIDLGFPSQSIEARVDRVQEEVSEPMSSRPVPGVGFIDVELGAGAKGESHRWRRRIRSRASSQGTPPSGSASAAARRRSRSSRCSAVSVRASSPFGDAVPELLDEFDLLGRGELKEFLAKGVRRHGRRSAVGPAHRQVVPRRSPSRPPR